MKNIHHLFNITSKVFFCHLERLINLNIPENTMSDREPTRWQHNHVYPHPISPCGYT